VRKPPRPPPPPPPPPKRNLRLCLEAGLLFTSGIQRPIASSRPDCHADDQERPTHNRENLECLMAVSRRLRLRTLAIFTRTPGGQCAGPPSGYWPKQATHVKKKSNRPRPEAKAHHEAGFTLKRPLLMISQQTGTGHAVMAMDITKDTRSLVHSRTTRRQFPAGNCARYVPEKSASPSAVFVPKRIR